MASGPTGLLVPLSEGFESHEDVEEQSFRGGVLDVRIHDAQGIHNICIYDKQDVFAKFSFTHGKGEPFSTQVITKGGKNPVFNESFQLPVTLPNSVLKCEMWMSSRAHSYLEDQLLGFVLVPLSSLTGKNGIPEEYGLSSTELFHSPAGVVRLTLVFREGSFSDSIRDPESAQSQSNSPVNGSPPALRVNAGKHTFIKVFEDGHGNSSGSESPTCYESEDIERIEFPDLQAASEDQQLVSSYLQMSSTAKGCTAKDGPLSGIITGPPFLFEAKQKPDDGVVMNSFSHRGEESSEKDRHSSSPSSCSASELASSSDDQSDNSSGSGSVKQFCSDKDKNNTGVFGTKTHNPVSKQDSSLSSLTQESPVMQQQIVDMYMKSMQQFTEALAKMQLPLDLDKAESSPNAKKSKSHQETEDSSKKHGSKTHRVFYGSRAFF